MRSLALKRIEHKKLLRSGISSSIKDIQFPKNKLDWERKNHKQILTLLVDWQLITANLLKDGLFSNGIYEYFKYHAKKSTAYNCSFKEILNFLRNKKGFTPLESILLYNCQSKYLEKKRIKEFIKNVYSGIVIDGRRIYPELYFPFIDEQYYNHFDWNKRIIGVALADFSNPNIRNHTICYIEQEGNKFSHGGLECGCKKESSEVSKLNQHLHVNSVKYNPEMYFSQLEKPLLSIGISDRFTTIFQKEMKRQCWCSTNSPGQCHVNATFANEKCGKSIRTPNGADCSQNNTMCSKVSISSYTY